MWLRRFLSGPLIPKIHGHLSGRRVFHTSCGSATSQVPKKATFHANVSEDSNIAIKVTEAYEVLSDENGQKSYNSSLSKAVASGGGRWSRQTKAKAKTYFYSNTSYEYETREFYGADTRSYTDQQIFLPVTSMQACKGVKKDVEIDVRDTCPKCQGTKYEENPCAHCNGTGIETKRILKGNFLQRIEHSRCSSCGGRKSCPECDGKGVIFERRKFTVEVPAGAIDGQKLSGQPIADRQKLYVTLRVESPNKFTRRGNDIYFDKPILFSQTVLGGTTRVEGISGSFDVEISPLEDNASLWKPVSSRRGRWSIQTKAKAKTYFYSYPSYEYETCEFYGEDIWFYTFQEIILPVTFMQACQGVKKDVEIDVRDTCSKCQGTKYEENPCAQCNGTGIETFTWDSFFVQIHIGTNNCRSCNGRKLCQQCNGKGVIFERRKFTVEVPAGVNDGQELSGQPIADRQRLYVTIRVGGSDKFTRRGNDIYSDEPISFSQAVLGGTTRVEGIHGNFDVEISPLEFSSSSQMKPQVYTVTKKIKDRGIRNVYSATGYGDHYVRLWVKIPRKLTRKQEEMLAKLEADTPGTINRVNKTQ